MKKLGRLDLQAELNDGLIVNIEMQVRDNKDIEKRTSVYASKVMSREVQKGTKYKEIKQIIMINILNYNLFGFDEYISETVTVLNKHRDYKLLEDIKWYFIELPKFRNSNPNMSEKINQWLAFIDDHDKELINMAEKNNKTLKKARQEMTYLTGDEEVRRIADLKEKWEMDYNSAVDNAREEALKESEQRIADLKEKWEMDYNSAVDNAREEALKESEQRIADLKEKWEMDYNSAVDNAREEALKESEQRIADLKEKWEMDYNSAVDNAREEALKESEQRIADLKEKWEMDYNSAVDNAREEAQLEIAKSMIEKHMPIDLICELTKLSKKEVEQLRNYKK